jgi:hypothetical protein
VNKAENDLSLQRGIRMSGEYPCLGFHFWGLCSYNPAQPGVAYFDIGSAVAALGFTLAIQQLLRPIYRFRLNAYGVQFWQLILAIFAGFIFVLFATVLPSLPLPRDYFWAYPIFWEIMAGIVIAGTYGFASLIILRPVRLRNSNLIPFVRASGKLLSEAKDEDRIEFSSDFYHNVEKLFKCARSWHVAEGHATAVEFERLRRIGAKPVITGRPPISAYYLFAHRKELEKASYACLLLRLLADEKFCSVLVSECPWQTAAILRKIGELRLHVGQAEPFIQELGRQAITNNNSMMIRETGYFGFGDAPQLSESIFQDPFIVKAYRPLGKLTFDFKNQVIESYISRLNKAASMMLGVALEHYGYWNAEFMWDVKRAYETLSHKLGWSQTRLGNDEYPESEWHRGIQALYRDLLKSFNNIDEKSYHILFDDGTDQYRSELVHVIASIVFESLSSIANGFSDFNGRFWHHCIGVIHDIYPFHDGGPEGLNPLQQQLAIQLIAKLKDNMNGYYPSISKVLLATIGPYEQHPNLTHRTAYAILRDAVYKELQNLLVLYERKPEKISDFLPANVTYDHKSKTLTHEYFGGQKAVTNLDDLLLPEIDFRDKNFWLTKNMAGQA